jgi:phosphoribosylformylglycinamidine cyclo-ligase
MYAEKDFDCAGFAVGLVDADQTWGPHRVQIGDQMIGVASSGCHSNGYSLLRKVFAEDLDQWIDELLTPTVLYPALVRGLDISNSGVHAIAHITGGGMDNVARVLPSGHHVRLKEWKWPKIFEEVQKRTEMSSVEMMKTLNCGVGLVMVVAPDQVETLTGHIQSKGFQWQALGEVVSGQGTAQVLYPDSSLEQGKGTSG